MATTAKAPVLVVLQLSGGNDYMNTVMPYKDPLYWDYRPRVAHPRRPDTPPGQRCRLCTPAWGPYATCTTRGRWRSSMGWAIRTRCAPTSARWTSGIPVSRTKRAPRAGWAWPPVNSTRTKTISSPRSALAPACSAPSWCLGCRWPAWTTSTPMVCSPVSLRQQQRAKILERFAQNYSPVIGTDEVMKYLGQTGLEAMEGADILKVAPQEVLLHGAVPGHLHRQKAQGHRAGALRRSGQPRLLLRPPRLRHPRQSDGCPCHPVERRVQCYRSLLR